VKIIRKLIPQKVSWCNQLAGTYTRGVTKGEWLLRLAVFGRKCAYCGATGRLVIEHVEPESRGGQDVVENTVPACPSCNTSKGNRFLLEWVAAKHGFPNPRRPSTFPQHRKGYSHELGV
jgi:5-methylcytosine-specific restriction endonuclease McrA